MVHAGEEDFASATFLGLVSPFKEPFFGWDASAVDGDDPLSIILESGIDCHSDELTAEVASEFGDKVWPTDSGRVDTDLVGTCSEESVGIGEFANATTDGERDVDVSRDAFNEVGKSFASLVACGDVEKDEFVGSLTSIFSTEFDGVANILDIHEVDTFDSLPIADVQTRYDTFCNQSRKIFLSNFWNGLCSDCI